MLILCKKVKKVSAHVMQAQKGRIKIVCRLKKKNMTSRFDWRIRKKLFPFMKPFRKYMIIALVFNTLCALVDIALPLFQQYAINHFISGNTTEGIGALQELI